MRRRHGMARQRKLGIKSLASDSPHYRGEIARIGLVGSDSSLVWSRSAEGVTVNLPETPLANKRTCLRSTLWEREWLVRGSRFGCR